MRDQTPQRQLGVGPVHADRARLAVDSQPRACGIDDGDDAGRQHADGISDFAAAGIALRRRPPAKLPPQHDGCQEKQRHQTPPVGRAVVLERSEKRTEAEVYARREQQHNANLKSALLAGFGLLGPPVREHGAACSREIQSRLMANEPRHPRIRRSLNQKEKCIGQKCQQTIDRRKNEIRSCHQPQQRVEQQSQMPIFLARRTNPSDANDSILLALSGNRKLPRANRIKGRTAAAGRANDQRPTTNDQRPPTAQKERRPGIPEVNSGSQPTSSFNLLKSFVSCPCSERRQRWSEPQVRQRRWHRNAPGADRTA